MRHSLPTVPRTRSALAIVALLALIVGSGGCAQVPRDGGFVSRQPAVPVVVDARETPRQGPRTRGGTRVTRVHSGTPADGPAAPQRTRPPQPRVRAVQATPEPVNAPPPLTEAAEGYWIVSSRQVKCAPGAPDSSQDLGYLYRTPRNMVPYPREALLGSLRPDRPVCIAIHGSYNYWPDVLAESERSFRWVKQAAHGRDVQFVYFTWPADGYAHLVFPVELAVMGRRSAIHGVYLANLMSRFPADQPVTLVGHSHGARCAVAALHALGGGAVDDGSRLPPGTPSPTRVRAVLLAAAVDHDWLNPGERYGQALQPVERMLVVHNTKDTWLRAYPLKNLMGNDAALGHGGLQFEDRLRLSDQGQKITLLDASQLAGRSHDFAAFNSRPEFAAAITPFVTFEDLAGPPLDADPYRPTGPTGPLQPLPQGRGIPETASKNRPAAPQYRAMRGPRKGASPAPSAERRPQAPLEAPSPRSHPNHKPASPPPANKPKLTPPTEHQPSVEFWIDPIDSEEAAEQESSVSQKAPAPRGTARPR